MTEVAFHFNAPDKQAYVCRFARKAVRHGARLVILGSQPVLAALSPKLWAVSPTDFLAHAFADDGGQLLAASGIVLTQRLENLPHHDVLVNLSSEVPVGFEQFAKIIEIVSATDEMDRQDARTRWKDYAAQGVAIVRHDLKLKG